MTIIIYPRGQQQQKICDLNNGNPFAKGCGGKWETHPCPNSETRTTIANLTRHILV